MWQDPIVQETRRLRDAFAAQHGYDADAIFQAILGEHSRGCMRLFRDHLEREAEGK